MGFKGKPGESYQPSNGTEGEGFISCWCLECERDREYREHDINPCMILTRTMVFNPGDEDYPEEWTYDEDGKPCCSAFLPIGAQLPTDPELEHAGQATLPVL